MAKKKKKWIQQARAKMEKKGTVGKFTQYCGGKVTQACIDKAKKSGNPTLVREAVFAENMRKIARKRRRRKKK